MPTPFKELNGSPSEQYDLEGFTAHREFLIAWEDRDAFASEVLGIASAHGGQTWASYPDKPAAVAIRLRYEPLSAESPDAQAIAGLTEGLNSYRGTFAKASVDYRTVTARDRIDGPENERGTHLTYRMLYAVDRQPVLPEGWQWSDLPSTPVPDDLMLDKLVPVTEHQLTWHQVVSPPWTAIQSLQGKINAAEFLGCPAGTLLFVGAEANKLYRGGFGSAPSEFCWQILYVFRQRANKQGGQVYGWNHQWRGSPAGWAELTSAAGPLYESADFNPLFQSESP